MNIFNVFKNRKQKLIQEAKEYLRGVKCGRQDAELKLEYTPGRMGDGPAFFGYDDGYHYAYDGGLWEKDYKEGLMLLEKENN